jgi:hypothetical protein
MLLVSPFHDYYDGALGVAGVDKGVVFNRKPVEAQARNITADMARDFPHYDPEGPYTGIRLNVFNHDIFPGYVIFCGKKYSFLKVPIYEDGVVRDLKYRFIYNNFMTDARLLEQFGSRWRKSVERFEKEYAIPESQKDFSDLNKKYQSPILASFDNKYGRTPVPYNAAINPVLENLEFFKVFNAFDAFQEVYHFVGNILTNNEDPPELVLDEKTKLSTKGMDKTSFKRTEHPRKSKRDK